MQVTTFQCSLSCRQPAVYWSLWVCKGCSLGWPKKRQCYRLCWKKQEVQPSEQLQVTSTWHCLASSQYETIYCHTACQQQPQVVDFATRVEHCSMYSHKTWSTNQVLFTDLKQRIKFQIKKNQPGTTIFFPSWDKSTSSL